MDENFLNDTTVYYNIPVPPVRESFCGVTGSKRRSTLPRPHSSCAFERSSCPSSPQLSSLLTGEIGVGHRRIEANGVAGDCDPVGKGGRPKKDEVVYQNVLENVPVSKSRKKGVGGSLFPWWKRKKGASVSVIDPKREGVLFEAPDGEVEEKGTTPSNEEVARNRDPTTSSCSFPPNYLILPLSNTTSTNSSSTTTTTATTINDDEDGAAYEERTLGGVSYVRPSRATVHPPRKRVTHESQNGNGEPPGKIGNWVREWRRKSRWLTRRRREKNPRHNGEGDVDIALVHCSEDTGVWADYLHDSFTQLLQDKLGQPEVSVEKLMVESFAGYSEVPVVQATRLNNAKLQIVIISPGFLSFLSAEAELCIGKFLRPKRVLALLLGVTPQTVKNDRFVLSSLYSFDEWAWLQVRDRDTAFITQLHEESLRLLNRCDLFDQCRTSSAFSLCPRKITENFCKVYIHLKTPLSDFRDRQIHVTVESKLFNCSSVPCIQRHNPYTLSFDMPEKFLGVSTFLKVNLYVDGSYEGTREIKSEGPLEILKDVLKSASDPTGLMCQALRISPASNELDDLLAERVKEKLPSSRDFNYLKVNNENTPTFHELPTWLHFSAFYGLQNFTWSLLDVPCGEKALLVKNCKGQTPAMLALQSGYSKLAQDLENVIIIASLTKGKVNSRKMREASSNNIEYSPVPHPRPCSPNISNTPISNYDTPPHPRIVKEIFRKTPITTPTPLSSVSEDIKTSTPKSELTQYANLLLNSSSSLASGMGEVFNANSNSESGNESNDVQEYLDMSGMSIQSEEYQKQISILVDAWDKRDDAKTFLSEYEEAISKFKKNFNLTKQNAGENISYIEERKRELSYVDSSDLSED